MSVEIPRLQVVSVVDFINHRYRYSIEINAILCDPPLSCNYKISKQISPFGDSLFLSGSTGWHSSSDILVDHIAIVGLTWESKVVLSEKQAKALANLLP